MKFGSSECAYVMVQLMVRFERDEGIPTSTSKITDEETDKEYKYFRLLLTNEYMITK